MTAYVEVRSDFCEDLAGRAQCGLCFAPDVALYIHRKLAIARVARQRLPANYSDPVMGKAGAPDRIDIFDAQPRMLIAYFAARNRATCRCSNRPSSNS